MHRWLVVSGLSVVLCPAAANAAGPHGEAAAAATHTIRTSHGSVTRIGAFRITRDPTVRAAIRVFGRPSSQILKGNNECQVDWRRLRLRVYFANYGGHAPDQTTCSSTVGRAQSFTVRGRRFRTWEGLRVGDRSATITERHHSAEFRRGSWWLRTAISPFGDESEYAVVAAIVGNGRVRVLRGWIGAAGE